MKMARRWDDVRRANARRRLVNILAILAMAAFVAIAARECQDFQATRAVVAAELGRMP